MIRRVVKINLNADKVDEFIDLYLNAKDRVLAFEGIDKLELFKSKGVDNVYFTVSEWVDENALNTYRKSDFFRKTWIGMKACFNSPAEAWSLESFDEYNN